MERDRPNLFDQRRGGVLLHLTSLPGPFDGGVLGADARRFVDCLAKAGFSIWQTLPLGPVDESRCPYAVRSTEAGDPRLIDLSLPAEISWRPTPAELEDAAQWDTRSRIFRRIWKRFCQLATRKERGRFLGFVRRERRWLMPFATYEALRAVHDGQPWWQWPEPVRTCQPGALARLRREQRDRIRQTLFEQYLFHEQWQSLRGYAHDRGVYLFGDLPVYVNRDSVEVWWRRELFQVDALGHPGAVSGVPPDYFTEDGQLWGHPIYNWAAMRADNFGWWLDRIRCQLQRFDLVRIDHFRALESYWEVPAGATTARSGRWAPGPGAPLLEAVASESMIGSLVAEDLGMITPAVRALRDRFHLPGMLVLQFAFDGSPDNPFLPENHRVHSVVYTGTHDNDTTLGWYRSLSPGTRREVQQRLGVAEEDVPAALIEAACRSRAQMAVLPMQDLLELGSAARMNTPGTTTGNWEWRFRWEDVGPQLWVRCEKLIRDTGR